MTSPAEPSTPSGSSATTTKATDHELQKHDIFTRYGHRVGRLAFASDRKKAFPVASAGSGTILLVEDNPDVAAASAGLLEQLGYAVRWVSNAEAALAEIETEGIDLVFSDIVMPGKWTA